MADKGSRDHAQATFRQFAWNLAGTLAAVKGGRRLATPKPAKR